MVPGVSFHQRRWAALAPQRVHPQVFLDAQEPPWCAARRARATLCARFLPVASQTHMGSLMAASTRGWALPFDPTWYTPGKSPRAPKAACLGWQATQKSVSQQSTDPVHIPPQPQERPKDPTGKGVPLPGAPSWAPLPGNSSSLEYRNHSPAVTGKQGVRDTQGAGALTSTGQAVPIFILVGQETGGDSQQRRPQPSPQTPYSYCSVKPNSKTLTLLFKHHILQ